MPNFFTNLFIKPKEKPKEEQRDLLGTEDMWKNPVTGTLNFSAFNQYSTSMALKISTVHRCLSLISDAIASMPLLPYKFNNNGKWKSVDYGNNNYSLYNLLNVQPNDFQSAFIFKKNVVITKIVKGQTFILVDKARTGEVLSLTQLNSDYVQILINGALVTPLTDLTTLMGQGQIKLEYVNMITGKIYDKSQIIHIINYPDQSGLIGISTLSHAAQTLGNSYYTNEHSSNFFKNGANAGGILTPKVGAGNISPANAIKAKKDFISSLSPELGGTSGGLVVLDAGLDYQPITLNAVDSQMIENKKFNVLDVCRFFGVPPSLAFSETQKYSTSEHQMLDFLNNCLLPITESLENEFFRKLYLPSEWLNNDLKFYVENLMKLDATTKADVNAKLIGAGVRTVNEARELYNADYPVAGGNKAFISTNLQSLDNPIVQGTQPTSGATTQTNFVDNKLKTKN